MGFSFWESTSFGSRPLSARRSSSLCSSTVAWQNEPSGWNASLDEVSQCPGGPYDDRRPKLHLATQCYRAVGGISPFRPGRNFRLRRSGFSIFPEIFEYLDCAGRHDASRDRCLADDLDHCDWGDRYLGWVYDRPVRDLHGSMF